jgi:hypothetical protein
MPNPLILSPVPEACLRSQRLCDTPKIRCLSGNCSSSCPRWSDGGQTMADARLQLALRSKESDVYLSLRSLLDALLNCSQELR